MATRRKANERDDDSAAINGALRRPQLVLPAEDSEVEDQFTTHTCTLHNGIVVYSKGNDHIVDAVRCALLAREKNHLDEVHADVVMLTPITTDPIFV